MGAPALSEFISASDLASVEMAGAELKQKLVSVAPTAADVDAASVSELRDLVKLLIQKQAPAIEPLGEDSYSGLPVFFDKPECPRCKPFSESWRDPISGLSHKVCHDCSQPIPHSIEFQNSGIESATIDHMHLHTVPNAGGRQIRIIVRRELCLPCFRIDWAKVNPTKACDL